VLLSIVPCGQVSCFLHRACTLRGSGTTVELPYCAGALLLAPHTCARDRSRSPPGSMLPAGSNEARGPSSGQMPRRSI